MVLPVQGRGVGGAWRSSSMDVLPFVDTETSAAPPPQLPAAPAAGHYPPALAQLHQLSQLSQLAKQHHQLQLQKQSGAAANQKLAMIRSNAFESATQFTDQYSAAFYPDPDTDFATGDQV